MTHAYQKLSDLRKKVNTLYHTEIRLRKDEAEFVKIMENLTEDLQYSSMLGSEGQTAVKEELHELQDTPTNQEETVQENTPDQDQKSPQQVAEKEATTNLDSSILCNSIREMNTDIDIILASGERINIYDLLRIEFFINTCLKDMDIMKKRMLNPNYKNDQVFSNYFFWYRRIIQNTRKFCRKVLRKNRKK